MPCMQILLGNKHTRTLNPYIVNQEPTYPGNGLRGKVLPQLSPTWALLPPNLFFSRNSVEPQSLKVRSGGVSAY